MLKLLDGKVLEMNEQEVRVVFDRANRISVEVHLEEKAREEKIKKAQNVKKKLGLSDSDVDALKLLLL
jgi:ribosomal protein L24